MREIRFRGKSYKEFIEENEWIQEHLHDDGFVYGKLAGSIANPIILGEVVESCSEYISFEFWVPVNPETVGQFTGLLDKNGVEIYEGDICNFYNTSQWTKGMEYGWQVSYDDLNFCFRRIPDNGENYWIGSPATKEIEVIGNIHEVTK